MAKILMVIAPKNYQDLEYEIPKGILEEKGHQVFTASTEKVAYGYKGNTETDVLLDDASANDYDALIFVGGSGSHGYFDNKKAQKLAQNFFNTNKLTCAICSSVSVFANAGILKDKKATCYIDEADNLKAKGAMYTGRPVEQDGIIITANGPAAAELFGKTIANTLEKAHQ